MQQGRPDVPIPTVRSHSETADLPESLPEIVLDLAEASGASHTSILLRRTGLTLFSVGIAERGHVDLPKIVVGDLLAWDSPVTTLLPSRLSWRRVSSPAPLDE
ncbi:MAG: hypothetical protein GEU73_00425 [Chloroflexi bacterium]|nr:hypothetical protein [Chloroflexota bacterium]